MIRLNEQLSGLPTVELSAEALGILLAAVTLAALWVILRRRSIAQAERAEPRPRPADPGEFRSILEQRSRATAIDPAEQLAAVQKVDFQARPVLTRDEMRFVPFLERAIRDHGRGHRLVAHIGLAEVLKPLKGKASTESAERAQSALGPRRLDFAIVDRFGNLTAAIGYEATDAPREAVRRDAVLREALLRAAIPFIEFAADWTPEQVRNRIRKALIPEPLPTPGE